MAKLPAAGIIGNDALEHNGCFESPWHAELFAIAVLLCETKQLDRAVLSHAFNNLIPRAKRASGSATDEEGLAAALKALESALADRGVAYRTEIDAAQDEWRRAYLAAPHGAPITLRTEFSDG